MIDWKVWDEWKFEMGFGMCMENVGTRGIWRPGRCWGILEIRGRERRAIEYKGLCGELGRGLSRWMMDWV